MYHTYLNIRMISYWRNIMMRISMIKFTTLYSGRLMICSKYVDGEQDVVF